MKLLTSCAILLSAAAQVGCVIEPAEPPHQAVVAPPTLPAIVHVQPQATKADAGFSIPYGYKKVTMSDGEERFCRNDTFTGTRTQRQKVCLTAAQLKASQDSTQNFIDQIQKHGVDATKTCTPLPMPGCPNVNGAVFP